MDIQEIAKLLGQRGGQARAKNLTASRRKEIASNASRKRWGNPTAKHTPPPVGESSTTVNKCTKKFKGFPCMFPPKGNGSCSYHN